ncbi:RabGAP/TBC [Sanghuangporus baumii]|uniref:RabGAP/TBC n=1 Tax=Sanghuangporus baumii TaxID=108892 RepID=A0A9Q5HWD9_SANBA|nr:RabGAP/TBC [Sanghuangporus baumii]
MRVLSKHGIHRSKCEREKLYSFLVHFHDEYELHDIFLPGSPGLLEATQLRLWDAFLLEGRDVFVIVAMATVWVLRGPSVYPYFHHIKVLLSQLTNQISLFYRRLFFLHADYLTSTHASFGMVLSLLSSFFVREDEDALLRWVERALDDKNLRAEKNQRRAEWRGLVREKKDGGVLL